jgi:fructose-1,6-bisphosphatase/sedoheptulose 1,7-bisphosphatase-like protein
VRRSVVIAEQVSAIMLDSLVFEDIQKVTSAAAASVMHLHGSQYKNEIDGATVMAMRNALNELSISGTVFIGVGQKDNAPMFKHGEKLGT